MKLVTLKSIFKELKGATMLGLDTETSVVLLGGKSNPMQGHVTKRMTGAVVMAFSNANHNSYEVMVRNQLEKLGEDGQKFKVGVRPWGKRLPNMPIIEHEGNYYLEVVFVRGGKTEYLLDGQLIDKAMIQGLKQSAPQALVTIRTFKLESILAIRTNSREYK